MQTTVAEIRAMLRDADEGEFQAIERSLAADTRKGVKAALETARRRLRAEAAERERLEGLYGFDASYRTASKLVVGLDEVGRGAVAGPLAVGAVVLPAEPHISGLNDSKQLSPEQRETISLQVRETALAYAVQYVEPGYIDSNGMASALRAGFSGALAQVDALGLNIETVLIDGNPLGLDPREVNVVKGDSKSASIAAASIVAKVARDELMKSISPDFPQYGFSQNKGYASDAHVKAIRECGLSPVHRESFCRSFEQQTLF